jgi:hypothetical protein
MSGFVMAIPPSVAAVKKIETRELPVAQGVDYVHTSLNTHDTSRALIPSVSYKATKPAAIAAIPPIADHSIFAAAPVYPAGPALAVGVELAPKAAQSVKFCPPKNFPTVSPSFVCSSCRIAPVVVAFVPQYWAVKLNMLALPSQMLLTTVDTSDPVFG